MINKMEEGHSCDNCKHYNCYDDGDGRWDIWCSKPHEVDDGSISTWKPNDCNDFEADDENE